MNTRAFLLSILLAGAAMGILANLPLLNLVNCILCLWIWLGGILGVFLYSRFQPDGRLSLGQAAALGALAGVVAALVGALVYTITSSLQAPIMDRLTQLFQIEGDMPWRGGGIGGVLTGTLIFLCLDVVLYPIFGALGHCWRLLCFGKSSQP